MVQTAVFCVALTTVLMRLSGTGFLHSRSHSLRSPIEADGVWTGILASLGPTSWAYMIVKLRCPDNGLRKQGLAWLMLLAVVIAALCEIMAMFLWSLVMDKLAHGYSVIAMYPSDFLAFSLVAVFILAMFAWSALCVVWFARETLTVGFIGLVVLFAVGVIGAWQSIRVFDKPPGEEIFLVWAAFAVLGLTLLPITAAVATRRKHHPSTAYEF